MREAEHVSHLMGGSGFEVCAGARAGIEGAAWVRGALLAKAGRGRGMESGFEPGRGMESGFEPEGASLREGRRDLIAPKHSQQGMKTCR